MHLNVSWNGCWYPMTCDTVCTHTVTMYLCTDAAYPDMRYSVYRHHDDVPAYRCPIPRQAIQCVQIPYIPICDTVCTDTVTMYPCTYALYPDKQYRVYRHGDDVPVCTDAVPRHTIPCVATVYRHGDDVPAWADAVPRKCSYSYRAELGSTILQRHIPGGH